MKKTLIWVLIAIVFIGVAVGLFLLVGGKRIGQFAISSQKNINVTQLVSKEYTAKAGINKVECKLSSDDIIFDAYDGDVVKVEYLDLEDGTLYDFSENEDTLTIRRIEKTTINIFGYYIGPNIHVYVPEGELKKAAVETSSGNISLENLYIENVSELNATSGDISIENLKTDEALKMSTSSGGILLNNVKTPEAITIKATSGNIEVQDTETSGDFSSTTSSGNCELINLTVSGDCYVKTTSGDFRPENVKTEGTMMVSTSSGETSGRNVSAEIYDAETTSGDIRLRGLSVTKEVKATGSSSTISVEMADSVDNYEIFTSTTSGDSNISNVRNNSAEKSIDIKTTSGDINITFK